MPRLTLSDGQALNYRLDGPEGAPWLVFGNSLMTDLTIWDAQVAALSADYRILRYDQRGHGASSVPAEAAEMARLSADLAELVAAVGACDLTYVGLSMGVPTGLGAVAGFGDRLAGFVGVDGLCRAAPGGGGFWEERIATARAGGMGLIADQTCARWLVSEEARAALGPVLHAMIAATPLEGFAACAAALMSYDVADAWLGLKVPSLLIAGAEDQRLLPGIEAMIAMKPNASQRIIPAAGHLPNFERVADFNSVLLEFLQKN